MSSHLVWLAIVLSVTLALSLVATFATRSVARRVGFIAKPRAERWHSKPTALAGGVGIYVSFIAGALLLGGYTHWRILLGATAMFALGMIDDVFHLKPYAKLVGQFVIAAVTVASGPVLPWTPFILLNEALSVFWLIGITNALNLLDNMDGLSTGVALVSVFFQAIFFLLQGQIAAAALATALTGALAGFLVFNWNPASIFMGDCGALFLGYTLATLAMQHSYGRSRGLLATIAVPVLVMLVPIFDTTFVTITRLVRGRPVSQGGRDHTSHRLVTLGLSERTAVSLLIALGAIGGTIAVLARLGISAGMWIGVPLIALTLGFLGVHLARTDRPSIRPEEHRSVTLLSSLAGFAYKRRIFEIVVDVVLAMVAFVAAFLLRFDGSLPRDTSRDMARVFLVVVAVKLAAMLVTRAYDGVWRYVGLRDLARLVRGALLGSVAVFVVLGIWIRFGALSRGALVMDAMLFATLVCASRVSFRVMRVMLGGAPPASQRGDAAHVVLWGAGDLGEQLALRLLDDPEHGLIPVAFVDDDPLKRDRIIHGIPVRGDSEMIPKLLDGGAASVVLVASAKVAARRLEAMAERVGPDRIRRVRMVLEPVSIRARAVLPSASASAE